MQTVSNEHSVSWGRAEGGQREGREAREKGRREKEGRSEEEAGGGRWVGFKQSGMRGRKSS